MLKVKSHITTRVPAVYPMVDDPRASVDAETSETDAIGALSHAIKQIEEGAWDAAQEAIEKAGIFVNRLSRR